MRLMHLVLDLDPGGTQRLVIEMSKRLRQRMELQICCLDRPGEWAHELIELGIPVVSLWRRPGFRPSMAREIAGLARRHGTDIVHCHHYSPFIYGTLAARLYSGLRVVYTEHGRITDTPPSGKRKLANLVFARLPGRFHAVSRNLRQQMIAEGFPSHRVEIIHNGIEVGPSPSAADRAAARRLLHLSDDILVIGTVARFDPVKDLETLIEAFGTIARERPEAHLVLVGDGQERSRLTRAVERAGVAERTHFAGARRDARRLLPAFDIFANTSLTEGISVTLLEAMAASLPVVATQVGGTPEVVIDGETGILVRPRDSHRLAAALGNLADDSTRRAELGDGGRDRVCRSFTVKEMIEEYLRVYSEGDRRLRSQDKR